MMGAKAAPAGPDFTLGVAVSAIPEGGTLAGRVGDEPVLLSRFDDAYYAVGGACTHYGAALASGLVDGNRIFCPLHHACFDLRTGRALRAPALDPLPLWRVAVEAGKAYVREHDSADTAPTLRSDVDRILIVGGGAAALACADALRGLGYAGGIRMLSADRDPPYDRPNLSKDYLAGTAPEAWLPLRGGDWFRERDIELRLETEILRIDGEERVAHSAAGEDFPFDRLLLATGSEPRRLDAPGFDRENVFTLRSLADARAIACHMRPGARAVIIGSSFVGLEAAAALRQREVEVDIVSVEEVPFSQVLGPEIGGYFRRLHEAHGVRFHMDAVASSFDGSLVRLADGTRLEADFVLVGIGVRPRTELARTTGLAVADGVWVDRHMQTGCAGIFAAGDIAAYPDPFGERIRIEHWVTAERQGQVAAANMLGLARPFDAVPFFWTEQYGTALRYVGRAAKWDALHIEGDIEAGQFTARYYEANSLKASASIGRDRGNLEDEGRLEATLSGGRYAGAGTSTASRHPIASA